MYCFLQILKCKVYAYPLRCAWLGLAGAVLSACYLLFAVITFNAPESQVVAGAADLPLAPAPRPVADTILIAA